MEQLEAPLHNCVPVGSILYVVREGLEQGSLLGGEKGRETQDRLTFILHGSSVKAVLHLLNEGGPGHFFGIPWGQSAGAPRGCSADGLLGGSDSMESL